MRSLAVILVCGLSFLGASCIHYSFTGSGLPARIKTVEIPLPDNQTPKIGLDQKMYDGVYNTYISLNILRVVRSGGDMELGIRIVGYQNNPDEFDAQGNVKTYRVIITADVSFLDRKENRPLYAGTLVGTGIYNHTTEDENAGINEAIRKLNETIVNNTITGW
jgi:hypothetical protein